jgi:hypothetical protein
MSDFAKDAHADPTDASMPIRKKKPYTTPMLTEYGSVAKLTQGTLTTQSDGKTGGFKAMSCL